MCDKDDAKVRRFRTWDTPVFCTFPFLSLPQFPVARADLRPLSIESSQSKLEINSPRLPNFYTDFSRRNHLRSPPTSRSHSHYWDSQLGWDLSQMSSPHLKTRNVIRKVSRKSPRLWSPITRHLHPLLTSHQCRIRVMSILERGLLRGWWWPYNNRSQNPKGRRGIIPKDHHL